MSDALKQRIETQAKELFRIVNGRGDGGGEFAFNGINSGIREGWLTLAKVFIISEYAAQKITADNGELGMAHDDLRDELLECRGLLGIHDEDDSTTIPEAIASLTIHRDALKKQVDSLSTENDILKQQVKAYELLEQERESTP